MSVRNTQIGYVSSERATYVGALRRAGHDLVAIFQEETSWGADIRVGVGSAPTLPLPRESPSVRYEDISEDGFYPDYIPPDD